MVIKEIVCDRCDETVRKDMYSNPEHKTLCQKCAFQYRIHELKKRIKYIKDSGYILHNPEKAKAAILEIEEMIEKLKKGDVRYLYDDVDKLDGNMGFMYQLYEEGDQLCDTNI